MKRMLKKSKGFTLVELLIVVVIIGILAGMMMLSTGSATAKAEATKIVSDMRNMKAAAIMFYADGGGWPTKLGDLSAYLDGKIASADTTKKIGITTYAIASPDSVLSIQGTVEAGQENVLTALGKLLDVVAVSSDKVTMRIK